MTNPYRALLETFEFNALLVQALLPLQPQERRPLFLAWMKRLKERPDTVDGMNTHAEYMWFLVLNMQDIACDPPFDVPPPASDLLPLSNVVSPEMYGDIMEAVDTELGLDDKWRKLKDKYKEEYEGEESEDKEGEEDKDKDKEEVEEVEDDEEEKERKEKVRRDKMMRQMKERDPRLRCPPAAFMRHQPKPNDGAYCYACVFSDHRE